LIGGVSRIHHLQRDRPVEPDVATAVDRRHPAGGDPRLDAVPVVEQGTQQWVRRHRHIFATATS
jgi:hypothetical protein